MKPGNRWHYEWIGSEIILKVESKPHEFNGNSYWAIVDCTPKVAFDSSRIVFEETTYWNYRMGREGMPIGTTFYRKDANGNLFWFNDESNTESLMIPKNIKKGQTWLSGDQRLEFKIVSTNETFESKDTIFKDCLVISTKVLKPSSPGTYPGPSDVGSVIIMKMSDM